MRVAVIQMVSTKDVSQNLKVAQYFIEVAAQEGADIVVLPENFAFFGLGQLRTQAEQEESGTGPVLSFLVDQAKQHGVWLVGGTIPYPQSSNGMVADTGKVFASVPVIDDMGQIVGRYEKIHLFDAGIEGELGYYRESDYLSPGRTPVVVDTPWGKLGLAVCYDLRFPEYCRRLIDLGATMIAAPAAFTYETGKDHWLPLLQARAIENQVFVFASNQGGQHEESRRTWGHSCILGPWGNCITTCEDGEAVIMATLDMEEVSAVREKMPVLSHRYF